MSFSKVKIYNLTLNNLGESTTIQNTSQQDPKTITLNNYYDVAIKQVLKDFDWNFASTFRELTSTGSACLNPKYVYEYSYPNDCLVARELVSGAGVSENINFQVITNQSSKKVINTNISPAYLRYTRFVSNESYFTADFVMAMSWYLAFLTSTAITGSSTKKKEAYDAYQEMISKSQIANANEGYEDEIVQVSWLDAR